MHISIAERAACRNVGVEKFFHELGDPSDYSEAREICARCDVRIECGEYAINLPERYGMWGGMLPTERNVIRRQRKLTDDEGVDNE